MTPSPPPGSATACRTSEVGPCVGPACSHSHMVNIFLFPKFGGPQVYRMPIRLITNTNRTRAGNLHMKIFREV